ncbi:MAG: hypothetical protein JWP25_3571 [Bradyrhizobium sp.]|nr:hypothetical protein [Bradyrhizobium sp.]
MVHFISDKSLQRPGYVYDASGVGYPKGVEPHINWNHIDGPLLRTSDCGLHWLTYLERIQFFFGLTDINKLDRKHRRVNPPRQNR